MTPCMFYIKCSWSHFGVLLAFSLLSATVSAQKSPWQDYQKAFDRWADSVDLHQEKGWKWEARWLAEIQRRSGPWGRAADQSPYYAAAQSVAWQKQARPKTGAAQGWIPVGPDRVSPSDIGNRQHGLGRINCVAFHPTDTQTIWVGVGQGGIWKTTDDGANWTPINNNLPIIRISDIAVNPKDPDEIYVALGDIAYMGLFKDPRDSKRESHYGLGVYKTTNGGAIWRPTGLSFPQTDYDFSITRRIFIDSGNPRRLIAATSHGIFHSEDAGERWTQSLEGVFWDIEANPNNPRTLYASTGYFARLDTGAAAIYRSYDFGRNWTRLSTLIRPQEVQRIEIAVAPSDTSVVYALACDTGRAPDNRRPGFAWLHRSDNGGATWAEKSSFANGAANILHWNEGQAAGGQGTYDLALTVNPHDENVIYTGGVNIWGSNDGGATWKPASHWTALYGASIHADQHDMRFHPLDGDLYVCNDGGLFRTDSLILHHWNDFSWPTQWEDLSDGLAITSFYEMDVRQDVPGYLIAGSQDNSTYYRNPRGSWINLLGGDGMDCILHPTDTQALIASYQRGGVLSYLSGPQGIGWLDITERIRQVESGAWVTPIEQTRSGDVAYMGFHNVWYLENWNLASRNTQKLGQLDLSHFDGAEVPKIGALSVFDKGQMVYMLRQPAFLDGFGAEAHVYDARLRTWRDITAGLPDSIYLSDIVVDDDDSAKAWVVCGGFVANHKVFVTQDAGRSWTNISQGLPNVPLSAIAQQGNTPNDPIYVGSDVGVYHRTDNTPWKLYSDLLPNVIVHDLVIHQQEAKIYAATFGRGIWKNDLAVKPNVTSIQGEGPTLSARLDLYPNPAKNELSIRFHGWKESSVQWQIIDVFGRTLMEGQHQDAKQHEPLRLQLEGLPAGIYFIEIRDNHVRLTERFQKR